MAYPPRRKLLGPAGVRHTLKDVCRMTGARRSQIEYWVRRHLIEPELPSSGTGDHRGFSFRNLVDISIAVAVAADGAGEDSIHHAIRALRLHDPDELPVESPDLEALMARVRAESNPSRERPRLEHDWDAWNVTEGESPAAGEAGGPEVTGAGQDPAAALEAEDRRRLGAWKTFRSPDTRRAGDVCLLCASGPVVWSLLDNWEDLKCAIQGNPATRVVNMRSILERLEQATGDQWRDPESPTAPSPDR